MEKLGQNEELCEIILDEKHGIICERPYAWWMSKDLAARH
tara:strand:+ start:55 stop:174 length:120 start_codon:yes stop_codon:yes gene_type:complete